MTELDLNMMSNAAYQAELASRLLQNEAFNTAYASLIEDIEKRLFLTDPAAQSDREQLYYLHRAAQMFVNNIASRINHLVLNEETV